MNTLILIISGFLWGLLIALILWVYFKIKARLNLKDLLDPIEQPTAAFNKEVKKIKEDIVNLRGRLNEMLFFIDDDAVGGIAKGNEELGNGHLIMAEICFLREIFKKWDQPNAWVGLAHAYSALKRYEEALDAIKMAIKLDQKDPLFNREGQISIIYAEILIKLGRITEAAAVLENEVLAINPGFKKAQKLLEECKRNQHKK